MDDRVANLIGISSSGSLDPCAILFDGSGAIVIFVGRVDVGGSEAVDIDRRVIRPIRPNLEISHVGASRRDGSEMVHLTQGGGVDNDNRAITIIGLARVTTWGLVPLI